MPSKTEVWAYECPCCYSTYEPDQRPEDGRCVKCEDAPNVREKQSEFGAGLVVCLAKFSEHLWTQRESEAYELGRLKDGHLSRGGLSKHAQTTLSIAEDSRFRRSDIEPIDYAIHDAIHMWANGAGDHFYDLDEDRAPQPLKDLADLVLRMRNSHLTTPPTTWTLEDLERVRELWRESCVALDQMLGTVPNWGSY